LQLKKLEQDPYQLATWAPAPNTWQEGQSGNDLWEKVLSDFNKEHMARFGIKMNRPWEADADSRRQYEELKQRYESLARARAKQADDDARRLEIIANASANAIAKYRVRLAADRAATAIAFAAYKVAQAYVDALMDQLKKTPITKT